MPSRRIGSNINLCPQQHISVDAFDTFNSDTVNKLTRMISNNKDGVVHGLELKTERYLQDTVYKFDVFKSGNIYKESDWVLDSNCSVGLKSDIYLDGFIIRDITKTQTQKITFLLDYNNNYIKNCINSDVKCKFHCKFKLINGSPYKIIASIGDDSQTIEYPRHMSSDISFDITHTLFVDKIDQKIPLSLTFILIPEDYNSGTYGESIIKKDYYNGQSEIVIKDLDYSISLLSYIDKLDYDLYTDNINLNYPITNIHPSNKIIVTQGLAIKDDVLLQEFGRDKVGLTPTMILDVQDERCWLKRNPYRYSDFYEEGAVQYGYVLNKHNSTQILQGSINTTNNNLEFDLLDNVKITPIDDFQGSNLDKEIESATIVQNSKKTYCITFNTFSIDDPNQIYGSILYLKNKNTGDIIYRLCDINNTYKDGKRTYNSISKLVSIENVILDVHDIKLYVSAGPIKVSGTINEFNDKMTKWANVVIYYTYFKHPDPNKSYIGLIRDEDLNDPIYREDYLVLGRVRFISPNTIDIISYENRQQINYLYNLARNIDYINQIPSEYQIYWLNPFTHEYDVPTNVSDGLTKLASWINKCIRDSQLYIEHVILNTNNYFEVDKIVSYFWDDKTNQGHLLSKYTIDTTQTGLTDKDDHIPSSKLIKKSIDTTQTGLTDKDDHIPSSKLIKDKLNLKQDKLSGDAGKVLYCNGGENLQFRPILNDNLYVCLTQQEVDYCKKQGIDYKYIMQKWIRWGHLSNKQYGIDKDYGLNNDGSEKNDLGAPYWKWDNDKKAIIQPKNSVDNTGFVTYNPNNNIDVKITFKSDDMDNDEAGVVLLAYDEDGRQHVITFKRNLAVCSVTLDKETGFSTTNNGTNNFICTVDGNGAWVLSRTCYVEKQYNENDTEKLAYSYFLYDDVVNKGNNKNTTSAYIYKNGDYENGEPYKINDTETITRYKTCPVFYRHLEKVFVQPDRTKLQYDANGNKLIYEQTVEKTIPNAQGLTENVDYFRGWKGYKGGTQLNLIYKSKDLDNNNHTTITCRTTPFYENEDTIYEYDDTESITIDIDDIINGNQATPTLKNILRLFQNGSRWGVVTQSQPQTTFKIFSINTDEYNIIDVPNKIVWKFIDGTWQNSGEDIYKYIHAGTQYYNSITSSMYWSDINRIVTKLNSVISEEWTFEDFDGNSITKKILIFN